jgi:hypothetical protein
VATLNEHFVTFSVFSIYNPTVSYLMVDKRRILYRVVKLWNKMDNKICDKSKASASGNPLCQCYIHQIVLVLYAVFK